MIPASTYRLQVRPSFDLYAAADVCDYLATLGVGAVYLSPLLPSAQGSEHGYDVVAFDGVDAARGGLDGWTRLLAAARARELGVVVDIVPNHTGVADAKQNPAWWDLLRSGQASEYASWFDIDWSCGRVLLPVLGDDFEPSQLHVDDSVEPAELVYFEHRFPIAPGTLGGSAAEVHDRQHYELVNYRRADTEQNYRRFFAVTSLAGLRVEDPAVFDATHQQVLRWVQADSVDGLRIDHPDGLADPRGYVLRLREVAGDAAWITVEKILEPGEELPADWPVDGTTGYDALTEVAGLFVDETAGPALDEAYRELTGDTRTFAEHVSAGKRSAATTILRAEVSRLARLVPQLINAEEALTELLVAFPVYRSYLPDGAEHLAAAIERARDARPDLADTIASLASRLTDPADELCSRFQQTSGAVMAKGVEDTTYYRYTRFIAANEVGGDPANLGLSPDEFHVAQLRRQQIAPRSMTTLSTHDTKRGEDVRARLAVLAELPDEWTDLARTLMATAPLPDRPFAYLLWQTFTGAGLIERERMHAYAEKAMREAATSTNWLDPDAAFEAAVHAVVERAYDDPTVCDPLAAFVDRITPYGWTNSLGQKLVQLTMPGVPDVYQGTATWEDSLVDPDNRRAVDFDAAREQLDRLDSDVHAPAIDASGAAKLWVVSRALRLRRDWPDLFSSYTPVPVHGSAADHAVAFDRGGAITVATRLPVGLERAGGWGDTAIDLMGKATDVISGVTHRGEVRLADLLADYPVALLVR
ncbi:MAG TPA: malto-oligosyltrehalose synthase [Jatrophihabitantaceae bacterium]|nr:malto-oligosyltrehalose synthase [Jatrophihabitantaceae bacterium]